MNLELLKARKLELEQAKMNMANNYNVIIGHIAECDYQISIFENDSSAKVDENVAEEVALSVE